MSTAFRTLSLGVGSFDKTKSSFHDVFKPSGSASKDAADDDDAAASTSAQAQPVAASLPAELDFFASTSGSEGNKKKAAAASSLSSSAASATAPAKKRKRPSSSSTPVPAPLDATTLNPFLRQHRIKITCGADNSSNHVDYPFPLVSWSEASASASASPHRYSLPPWLIDELESTRGWDLTPIQRAALPVALEGRDLLAMAPTGSGKTLAYLVPLLHRLITERSAAAGKEEEDNGRAPRAVILSPTRELATQIYDETRRLLRARPQEEYAHRVDAGKKSKKGSKKTSPASSSAPPTEGGLRVSLLTGGDKIRPLTTDEAAQLPSMPPLDLIIATPLRLQQALSTERYTLSLTHSVILDEADTLLGTSSAFLPQVDSLLSSCTNSAGGVQKSLFTATLPSSVETLARSLLAPDHVRLIVGRKDSTNSDVEQALRFVGSEEGKLLELRGMVKRGEVVPPTLLFVQTIERAKDLMQELAYDNLRIDAVHSDLTRSAREGVIRNFKQGKVWLLICTEVMARGLDFKGVDLVINYDLPTSTESYVHRVGRTGRAGRKGGRAVSFWTKEDAPYLRSILNLIKQSGGGGAELDEGLVPKYLLEGGAAAAAAAAAGGAGGKKLSKAAAKRQRKKLKTKPVDRQGIAEASGSRKLDEDRRERREGKRLRSKKKAKAEEEDEASSTNSGSESDE